MLLRGWWFLFFFPFLRQNGFFIVTTTSVVIGKRGALYFSLCLTFSFALLPTFWNGPRKSLTRVTMTTTQKVWDDNSRPIPYFFFFLFLFRRVCSLTRTTDFQIINKIQWNNIYKNIYFWIFEFSHETKFISIF